MKALLLASLFLLSGAANASEEAHDLNCLVYRIVKNGQDPMVVIARKHVRVAKYEKETIHEKNGLQYTIAYYEHQGTGERPAIPVFELYVKRGKKVIASMTAEVGSSRFTTVYLQPIAPYPKVSCTTAY